MYNRRALMILNHSLYRTDRYTQSEALKLAWQLAKQPLTLKAAGVTFENRQAALQHLTHYSRYHIALLLRRENNPFDANAIQVIAYVAGKGFYPVGHLPREWAAVFAPLLDRNLSVRAEYESVIGGAGYGKGKYGLRMKVRVA